MIGANCCKALEPIEVIPSQDGGPYAYRTQLGWCVVGPIKNGIVGTSTKCNRVAVKDVTTNELSHHHFEVTNKVEEDKIHEMLEKMYNSAFTEPSLKKSQTMLDMEEVSAEDITFLEVMNEGVTKVGKHYQLPLPFRQPEVCMPNNRFVAVKRLMYLKRKFKKDKKYEANYKAFMKDLLEKGYAKKAKQSADPGKIWYLPHHGVYNENKGKIRVVFDCGAEYRGKTLNAELISGPDLTNQLVGVLNRFREGKIAVTADIEAMYYQVFVKEEHRSMLRFLWWEDDNAESEIIDLEMNVHVFGSTSSASCSNYALKKTASDNEDAYNKEVSYTLIKNFYVDDLLKSHDEVNQLIDVIKDVRRMCQEGGFNLTKFTSSNKEVLESIPECHRRKEVKDFKMMTSLPSNRALGVVWSLEADEFRFELAEKSKPVTRRGMLSTLSSFYDPLGFISPYLLPGKIILQQLCASKVGWDDPVSLDVEKEWKSWLNSLKFVESVRIPRCLKPETLSEIVEASLHHFSDASEYGYGQVSYLCLTDTCGRISCRLLVSKSRVAPLKYTSIPRLELTAATISVKMSVMLKKEIQMKITKERFWTDSQVVLGYLRNQKKKFKIFVTNRVQMIKNNSNIDDWYYVPSKENPADIASRGGGASKLEQLSFWQDGPAFLKKSEKN